MPSQMSSAIHNQAIDKAFAKITILGFDIDRLKKDISTGNTGGITENELIQVLDGTKKELNIWRFIAESIEKNN
jgi:hypothetical protein